VIALEDGQGFFRLIFIIGAEASCNSPFLSLPDRFLTLGNISHEKTNSLCEVRNEMDNNSMLST